MSTRFQRNMIIPVIPVALMALAGCATTEVNESGMTGGTGLHLTGGAGPAVFDPSTASDPDFSGSVDDSSTTWEVGAGYRFNKSVGVEASYVDLGKFKYDGSYLGTPDSGTVENTGYKVGVTGYLPINNRFEAYGMLGAFRWKSRDNEVFGGTPYSSSESGTKALYGLGVQAVLNPQFDVRLGWERYSKVGGDDYDVFSAKILWYLFR